MKNIIIFITISILFIGLISITQKINSLPQISLGASVSYPYHGGTGTSTTPIDLKLLVGRGDGTYYLPLLTAGSNITISTSTTALTIAASVSGGGNSNWQFIGVNAIRPTTTVGIIVNASSTLATTTFTQKAIFNQGFISQASTTFTEDIHGIAFNELDDFDGSANISLGNNNLQFSMPGSGGITFVYQGTSGGHLTSILHNAGNQPYGTHLLHIQESAADNDVLPLDVVSDNTSDIAWFRGGNGTIRISDNSSATTTISSGASSFAGYVSASGFTGNASTSDALKVNGSNCTNQFPLGIDASGNVESCTTITTAYMDLTNITLADFLNDTDYITGAYATTTYLMKSSYFSTTTWAGGTQALVTTGALEGATLDTGQGAYELYSMNQNVLTTSQPTFRDLTLTYGMSAATTTLTGILRSVGLISNASSTVYGDFSAGNDILFVDNAGYVGIATTSPNSALEVSGNIYLTGEINTRNGYELAVPQPKCWPMASSTWSGTASTTQLGSFSQAIRITSQWCRGDSFGTTSVYLSSSTDPHLDTIKCGYTNVTDSSLSNNVFDAYEPISITLNTTTDTKPVASYCIQFGFIQD